MQLMSQFTDSGSNKVGKTQLKKRKKCRAPNPPSFDRDVKCQLTVDDEGERLTTKPQSSSGAPQHKDSVSTEEYDSEELGEEYSDEDEDLMDNVIDKNPNNSVNVQSQEVDTGVHGSLSPSSLAAWVDDIFSRDYIVDPPIRHLEAVADKFASTLTSWCRVPPKKD